MGQLAEAVRSVFNRTPIPFVTSSPSYGVGNSYSGFSYESYVNVVTHSPTLLTALNLIAQSAAEPRITGKRWRRSSPQKSGTLNAALRDDEELRDVYARSRTRHSGFHARLQNQWLTRNGFVQELPMHPLVQLLNAPNPYQTLSDLMKLLIWDYHLAGDWFVYKARGEFGNVQELWRLRPDKVTILPSRDNFIAGYAYKVNGETVIFPEEDVIRCPAANPLNDYRGISLMPAVAPLAQVESAMTSFLEGFYVGGGNTGPGAILTTKGALNDDAKAEVRAKLRRLFGHNGGMRETLVITANESTYTKLGLDRGLTDAIPKDVNALIEAHLSMPFGVPGSIMGLLIGYETSSYANQRQAWQTMWDIKMTPLLSDFDDKFTRSLCPEFAGIDEVCFDLSDIRALQEDQDAMHARVGKDVAGTLMSWQEGRSALGLDPDITEGIFVLPHNMRAVQVADLGEDVAPAPLPAPVPVAPAPEPSNTGLGSQLASALASIHEPLQIEAPKRGRPSLADDADARALYEKGEALRRQFPSMTAAQVAGRLGIGERTWMRYRSTFGGR